MDFQLILPLSNWIGSAPFVRHHIGGKSYVAWTVLRVIEDKSEKLNALSLEYSVSKTTDALHTQLGQSSFDAFSSPFPDYFETTVVSPALKL